MKSCLRLGALAALVLLLAIGGGCRRESTLSLRIGINDWPGYEFLYLAQAKGFFEDAGLSVRLVEFNSLGDAARAFERGQIDGLGCTGVDLLMARDRSDRHPMAVYTCDYSKGADAILARPEISGLTGLRGARVGVEIGSLGTYLLARAVQRAGLTLGDLRLVPSDQLSMEDAFQKGELDAVVTYPPVSVRLAKNTPSRTLFTSSEIPGEIVDVLALDQSILEQRPEAARALVKGFVRAQEFYRDQPTDAAVIMGSRERLSGDDFLAALTDGIAVIPLADQARYLGTNGSLPGTLQRLEETLRTAGQLQRAVRGPVRLATDNLLPLPGL